jgi:hypothetical protein
MAQTFPTISELKALFLQEYENQIGQASPLNNKAYLRIRSAVMAGIATLMQREVQTNTKENLAISASRAGLITIGNEYDLPIKDEQAAIVDATILATTGTVIPAGTNFSGDDNGLLYFNAAPVTAAGGIATLELTCRTLGVVGNLNVSQTLTISRNIAGVTGLTATVTGTDISGSDAEDTEDYRQRVLDIIRAPGGGGNSADYRNWAQEAANVVRAFPYSGLPWDDPLAPGAPPERTVYIEADTEIDPDGIPGATTLAAALVSITTDPITEQDRQPLGLTSDTLYVEPIRRTSFYTLITNAVFVAGTDAQVKADIATALDQYFLGLAPFVSGLDADADRNDMITSVSVGEIVQGVLAANSASADRVQFGDRVGVTLDNYQLGQGEKAKNGGITYA